MKRRNILMTALFVVLCVSPSSLKAAPCNPSPTALCLSGGRFEVKVAWKDFQGKTGDGQAVPLTADTGHFWFFSQSNVELIVKVLDARAINNKFWVFFGALTNVEYTLTVTDSVTRSVKTYRNPSGQFASVGDTSAFDGSAGAVLAAHETVMAQGTASPRSSIADIQKFIDRAAPAASAFTPCPAPTNTLPLASCRFAVDVEWTDPQGNAGSGQAVQLSADTGYFWFFSESNVELMVKVLDARPINGKFWVFFGALSNVEYTVRVLDTVSGALRTYHNPASIFASVGDTDAFRGGYGVSVETDASRAVSDTIVAAAGGALSATADDGTVFTLAIPPNALFFDQDITMTPVRATGAFPFAAGLAAGVDLQPAGLFLLGGATLTIHTAAPISRSEETPVAWNGSGEDFFLFPPEPAGADLAMLISHFGGYGVARGTDAEREAQLRREPLADVDLLSHRISPILRAGRTAAAAAGGLTLLATADWRSDLKTAMGIWYDALRTQMLAFDGEPRTLLSLVAQVLGWKHEVENALGPLDTVFPGRSDEIRSLLTRMFKRALQLVHTRCQTDLKAIDELPDIISVAEALELDVQLDLDEAYQCLTFKLRFESTIKERRTGDRGTVNFTHTALAELTLETKRTPSGKHSTRGEGTIDFTEISVTGFDPSCRITHTSGPTPFKAEIGWFNYRRLLGGPAIDVLLYDPGFPQSDLVVNCGDGNPSHFENAWWPEYYTLNPWDLKPDSGISFKQGGWSPTGQRDPWAEVQHHSPPGPITETTTFTLSHTPR